MNFNLKRVLVFVLGILTVLFLVACEEIIEEPTQYTVVFDSHGGTNVPSQTVEAGSLVTKPQDPTRNGFTFEGWFKDAQYTDDWIFETDTVQSNITLHAKWLESGQVQNYTVTFNANGGSAVLPVTKQAGSTLGALPTTTREGYTFQGWFLDQALTQAAQSTTVVNANMTLYAKWQAVSATKFTVTFNAGQGDVLPDSVEANENTKINQPDAEYTGYELVGWFKEPGFINQWDFENDVVTANITLYAKWEAIPEGTPITTTLEFYNLASGLIQYAPGDHFYLKFDLDFSTFDWDASIWVGDAIPIHNFHFNGNGKKISNLDIEAPNIGGIFPRMSGGSIKDLTVENINLKTGAQAGVLVGRIMNGSTVLIQNVAVLNATVEGSAAGVGGFVGHVQGATGKSTLTIEKSVLLNASVHSNSNATGGLVGDIESSKLLVKDLLLDVVVETTGERVGAILGEARRNGNNVNDLPELFVDGAVVYANLTGLRYLGGVVGRADNNMANLDEAIHGAASKVLPGEFKNIVLVLSYQTTHASDSNNGHIARSNVPTAENAYVFAFNYDRANLNGVNVPQANVFKSVEDFTTTLTLHLGSDWTKSQGELPSLLGYEIDLGHKVILKFSESVEQVQYVRDGQDLSEVYINPVLGAFLGWFDGAELFEGPVTEPVTLTAKFTEVFTVSFESNGGSTVASQQVLEGEKATEPQDPTRLGFVFEGWYIDAELTTLYDFDEPVSADLTLHAKWSEVELPEMTVSFESNGGSAVADIKVLQGGTITLGVPPTKEGFLFVGWFIDAELTTQFNPSTPITEDMTLYAKWQEEDEGGETPEGTPIFNAQEFYTMATTNNEEGQFYLANDIDFTGFTWVGAISNFKGELNGNGKTLKNLTQATSATNVYNGLFHNLNGAKVYNFTIENFTFTSTAATTRSAFIAGQVSGQNASYISDIVIKNSSISANEYVAAIVGRATGGVTSQVHISNIVLEDVTIRGYYVAGIVADFDATSGGSTITDIWAKVNIGGVELNHGGRGVGLAERLGGIASRVRPSGTAALIERVYMDITATSDKWGAGIIGDAATAGAVVKDVFVTGTITTANNSGRAILGANPSNTTVTNAYEYLFTGNGSGGAGGTVVESLTEGWWTTNLNAIVQSNKWAFNAATTMYQLVLKG